MARDKTVLFLILHSPKKKTIEKPFQDSESKLDLFLVLELMTGAGTTKLIK